MWTPSAAFKPTCPSKPRVVGPCLLQLPACISHGARRWLGVPMMGVHPQTRPEITATILNHPPTASVAQVMQKVMVECCGETGRYDDRLFQLLPSVWWQHSTGTPLPTPRPERGSVTPQATRQRAQTGHLSKPQSVPNLSRLHMFHAQRSCQNDWWRNILLLFDLKYLRVWRCFVLSSQPDCCC